MLKALIIIVCLLLAAAPLIVYACCAANSDINDIPPSDDYPEEWRWKK